MKPWQRAARNAQDFRLDFPAITDSLCVCGHLESAHEMLDFSFGRCDCGCEKFVKRTQLKALPAPGENQ
jgi:hypothetical protein